MHHIIEARSGRTIASHPTLREAFREMDWLNRNAVRWGHVGPGEAFYVGSPEPAIDLREPAPARRLFARAGR